MNLIRKAFVFAGILAALAIPGAAWATSTGDGWDHAQTVIPGSPCGHVGDRGTHGGERYECRLKYGQDCPRWAYVYDAHTPRSGKTAWPVPSCPCTSASTSPTPATTPTVTPTPSATPTASPLPVHSTAVAAGGSGSLPVTGSPVIWLVGVGILLTLAGLALRAVRARSTGI